MIDVRKAAHVVSFFAIKNESPINIYYLSCLLYLSNRESLDRHDMPIVFDKIFFVDKCPVSRITWEYLIGHRKDILKWGYLITEPKDSIESGTTISILSSETSLDDLDELSDSDIDILEKIWKNFHKMELINIIEWMHENFEEFNSDINLISYEIILASLGKENPYMIAKEIYSIQEIDSLFNR